MAFSPSQLKFFCLPTSFLSSSSTLTSSLKVSSLTCLSRAALSSSKVFLDRSNLSLASLIGWKQFNIQCNIHILHHSSIHTRTFWATVTYVAATVKDDHTGTHTCMHAHTDADTHTYTRHALHSHMHTAVLTLLQCSTSAASNLSRYCRSWSFKSCSILWASTNLYCNRQTCYFIVCGSYCCYELCSCSKESKMRT